jgi:hypothetical protein
MSKRWFVDLDRRVVIETVIRKNKHGKPLYEVSDSFLKLECYNKGDVVRQNGDHGFSTEVEALHFLVDSVNKLKSKLEHTLFQSEQKLGELLRDVERDSEVIWVPLVDARGEYLTNFRLRKVLRNSGKDLYVCVEETVFNANSVVTTPMFKRFCPGEDEICNTRRKGLMRLLYGNFQDPPGDISERINFMLENFRE